MLRSSNALTRILASIQRLACRIICREKRACNQVTYRWHIHTSVSFTGSSIWSVLMWLIQTATWTFDKASDRKTKNGSCAYTVETSGAEARNALAARSSLNHGKQPQSASSEATVASSTTAPSALFPSVWVGCASRITLISCENVERGPVRDRQTADDEHAHVSYQSARAIAIW